MKARARHGSAMVVGIFFVVILINVALLLNVVGNQLYFTHQSVTRALDLAAIAGATQGDEAQLLQNIPALDRTEAEAVTRAYAANNLRVAEQFMVESASTVAATMSVWVRNTGEIDPWTGAPVTIPTVFVEAPIQLRGMATHGVIGTAPGMLPSDPLSGAAIRVRVKAAFRLRA